MDRGTRTGKVALAPGSAYSGNVEARPVINLEETIGKTVGRRRAPRSPLQTMSSNKANAIAWQKALPYRMAPKGVYRFTTHQEAHEWMTQHTGPKRA